MFYLCLDKIFFVYVRAIVACNNFTRLRRPCRRSVIVPKRGRPRRYTIRDRVVAGTTVRTVSWRVRRKRSEAGFANGRRPSFPARYGPRERHLNRAGETTVRNGLTERFRACPALEIAPRNSAAERNKPDDCQRAAVGPVPRACVFVGHIQGDRGSSGVFFPGKMSRCAPTLAATE